MVIPGNQKTIMEGGDRVLADDSTGHILTGQKSGWVVIFAQQNIRTGDLPSNSMFLGFLGQAA